MFLQFFLLLNLCLTGCYLNSQRFALRSAIERYGNLETHIAVLQTSVSNHHSRIAESLTWEDILDMSGRRYENMAVVSAFHNSRNNVILHLRGYVLYLERNLSHF